MEGTAATRIDNDPDRIPARFELLAFMPYLMNRVGTLMERTIAPALKAADLSIDMWRVLLVLHFNGPMTLVELSRETGVGTSTLSRLVGRLIERDLVSRRRAEEDARTVRIEIRPDGEAAFEDIWREARRLERLVTTGFDEAALEQIKTGLRTIEAALSSELMGRTER